MMTLLETLIPSDHVWMIARRMPDLNLESRKWVV